MDKNTMWATIGGVIVLAIIGYFMFGNRSAQPTTQQTESPTTQATTSLEASQPKSLKDLLGLGTAQQCSFSDTNSQGKVYVNSGKVRGDFTTSVNGQATATHMIVDGTTSYIWMDGTATGFKATLTTTPQPSTSPTGNNLQAQTDVNRSVNYSCQPWVADQSFFALPAGVTFSDFSALVPGAATASGSASVKASQCAACDSAPAASRAQCRAAIGC